MLSSFDQEAHALRGKSFEACAHLLLLGRVRDRLFPPRRGGDGARLPVCRRSPVGRRRRHLGRPPAPVTVDWVRARVEPILEAQAADAVAAC